MDYAFIAPTSYLKPLELDKEPFHLLLAHLLERDEEYLNFYKQLPDNHIKLMDNSAYELYRQGKPMFDGNKLIELAKQVRANYIVMPDYPGEPAGKTAASALEFGPQFKQAGYNTFFVPQSRIGHLEEYISSFAWAASSPIVDYIGMSILGIPNAFGVDGNDLQRYVSRLHMFQILENRGLLSLARNNGKKIHCLGMTDGPNEIMLLEKYIRSRAITSWDSSAPIWAGIEGVSFDNSPTGLVNGKVKSHVDFGVKYDESKLPLIKANISYINSLIKGLAQ